MISLILCLHQLFEFKWYKRNPAFHIFLLWAFPTSLLPTMHRNISIIQQVWCSSSFRTSKNLNLPRPQTIQITPTRNRPVPTTTNPPHQPTTIQIIPRRARQVRVDRTTNSLPSPLWNQMISSGQVGSRREMWLDM